ncbi:MAG: amino acid ABC transporter permease [Eubacteriaceae bacterium]|nr:amino acid ABC transporter permease [Eubacteriaceae bacterium]
MLQVIKDIFTPVYLPYLLSGFWLTIKISITTVFCSLFIGAALALARNYEPKILGKLASIYIEIFRNTPLILWMMACIFMIRYRNAQVRGTIALILYTSSVMAEIIRGGLNSIDSGQFEAAKSQGFNFFQTMAIIVIPQCLMRIVPSLMSQIITTVKDTSFLAQFAIAEFFYNSKVLLNSLTKYVVLTSRHIFVLFGFVALLYFVFNFTLSVLARKFREKYSAMGN